jgi:hypothetical protein
MANPADERAATGGDRGRLRASHADREQVIEVLKDAFVQGRLTRNELDARAGQALAARTYAELAAVTTDIPAVPATPATPATPAAAGRPRPPSPRRRRPLAKAAAGSGGSLVIAAAAMRVAFILDPGPEPAPYQSWAKPFVFLAVAAVLTALGILVVGVAMSVQQRRSRGQLPPRPGPDGHALDAERSSASPSTEQQGSGSAGYPGPAEGCQTWTVSAPPRRTLAGGSGDWSTTRPSTAMGCSVRRTAVTLRSRLPATATQTV